MKTLIIPEGVEYIYKNDYNWDEYDSVIFPSSLIKAAPIVCETFDHVQINSEAEIIFDKCIIKTLEFTSKLTFIPEKIAPYCDIGKIILPNTIKIIGSSAFSGCGINEINLPNSILSIDEKAFSNVNFLNEKLILPEKLRNIGKEAFLNTNLKFVEFNDKLEIIDAGAFELTKIEEFNLPETVQYLGRNSLYAQNVKKISCYDTMKHVQNFKECPNKLYKENNISKKEISQFLTNNEKCNISMQTSTIDSSSISLGIEENNKIYDLYVDVSEGNFLYTSIKEIGPYFGYKNNVKILTLPALEKMDKFAFKEAQIKELNAPGQILNIPDFCFEESKIKTIRCAGIETVGMRAFNSTPIESIDLSMTKEIKTRAFSFSQIKNVKLNHNLKELPEFCFDFTQIKNIDLPDELLRIGCGCFSGSKLKTIKLPNKIKEIENHAFYNTEIKTIKLPFSIQKINKKAFPMKTKIIVFKNQETCIENNSEYNIEFNDNVSLDDLINANKSISEINQIYKNNIWVPEK